MQKILLTVIGALLFVSCNKAKHQEITARKVRYEFAAASSGEFIVVYFENEATPKSEIFTGKSWTKTIKATNNFIGFSVNNYEAGLKKKSIPSELKLFINERLVKKQKFTYNYTNVEVALLD